MDLFSELIDAVQDDMTIGDESSLYPLVTVKRAVNRAYRKAGALYRWAETEDAKKSSTIAGRQYYLMPRQWRPESTWRLEIDGVQYGETPDGSPMDYRDFMQWLNDDENDGATEKKWSVQGRKIFVYPTPTATGDYNISAWGQKTVDPLEDDGDLTIFSYSMPECNDAIVKEAKAILKAKGEDLKSGQFISIEAKQILTNAWTKIKNEKAKYEKVQPFFDVPDYFSGNSGGRKDLRGRFE